ncbi:MAG TPA: hypothetical protein VGS57_03410, partial [Thermoanaerobaculia bacterium]|nr:hypothetical protein [Thermoanaerobaculia bacterium]
SGSLASGRSSDPLFRIPTNAPSGSPTAAPSGPGCRERLQRGRRNLTSTLQPEWGDAVVVEI